MLKLNDEFLDTKNQLKMILIQSRSMSDPPLSDIHFKNKMVRVGTTLKSFWSYADKKTIPIIFEACLRKEWNSDQRFHHHSYKEFTMICYPLYFNRKNLIYFI